KNVITISVINVKNIQLYSILSSLVVGIIFGLFLAAFCPGAPTTFLKIYIFSPISTMFVSALQLIVSPLIFVVLVKCISNFSLVEDFGKVGKKIFLTFFSLMVLVLIISLSTTLLLNVGDPALQNAVSPSSSSDTQQDAGQYRLIDVIVGIVPNNIVSPFLNGDMLALIFLAVVCGLALALLKDKVPICVKVVDELDQILKTILEFFIQFLPLVLICNMATLVVGIPPEAAISIIQFIGVELLITAFVFALYCIFISVFAKTNPIVCLKTSIPVWIHTNAVESSTACLPNGIELCKKLKVPKNIYSLVMPLGLSLNKNGTVLANVVATFFLCNVFEVSFDIHTFVIAVVVIFLISLAAPGVNGGGIVCMSAILGMIGAPAEAISLYIILAPIEDLTITGTNLICNVAASIVVAGK
ncbi:MAG: dicarboxylate/amino acid:cation symporter, partial [Coriobacteriales bacterium]|nr:dicarboxylate/amino acid:cation symporter [Coriobacteriales bacterium]